MSQFADVIRYLASDEDPRSRISAIKNAVVENIHAADERVKVAVTDHFNHTFVPDLILSWPGETESRSVFLRTSYRAWDLLQDLDMLASERPILMPLVPIEVDDNTSADLEQQSSEQRTLITDPYGLEALDRQTDTAPVVSLLSHALLQGGRGLISSDRATRISEEVGAGFAGAQHADYELTSIAVQAAETALDSDRASQLNRLLHAVWIGSGASPSQFPAATGTTAILDAANLRFILELPDLPDPGFWDRIGRGLRTERLCELGDFPPSDNLQRLLAGCAYRLTAKACRVINASASVDSPRWEVVNGTLTMRTSARRIHFAPRYVRELPDSSLSVPLVTTTELKTRADMASVMISEVKMSNGDSTISYGSEERPDVSADQTLIAVESAIQGASVVEAIARVGSSGKTVRCNLREGTAAGNSNAMYYVIELAEVAVPLLARLSHEELADVSAAIGPRSAEESTDEA
ncbi:hypothetical protein [Phytohabitans kaempferiae]|uniref:WYL domain-containing protein n=1 Tax=Phytohabitans kaempferiae TaxID=1620943 RepID=A0ABV6MBF5_9ACTN